MTGINFKPSQRSSLVGVIAPISAAAVQTSAWIDATTFHNFLVLGKAIVQFTKANADDGKTALINLKQEELDFANGFKFFRLSITPAVAASLIYGDVRGFDPRYGSRPTAISRPSRRSSEPITVSSRAEHASHRR
jgi:hypothetical protein